MRGSRRIVNLLALAALTSGLAASLSSEASASSIAVTFNFSTTGNLVPAAGTAEGIATGTTPTKFTLAGQPGGGAQAKWEGSINAQVGFDENGNLVRIRFTGGSIVPQMHGSFLPGGWDPDAEDPTGDPGNTDGNFTTGVFEPGQYSYAIAGFVRSTVRDSKLTISSGNNVISKNSFTASYGLQFTDGVLALDAAALGSVANDTLTSQIHQLELDQNGVPVWRNPDTQAITPRFDASGDPSLIRDGQGNPLPQSFQNAAGLTGTLTATPAGGGNTKLDLTMPVDAKAIFYIGDFEVVFNFGRLTIGQVDPPSSLALSATVKVPVPGDANNDGKVNGADYVSWATGFNKFNTTANALYSDGDFTGDGKVDGTDYIAWASRFQPAGAAIPVPEPSTVLLSAIGGLGLALAAWRRRATGGR